MTSQNKQLHGVRLPQVSEYSGAGRPISHLAILGHNRNDCNGQLANTHPMLHSPTSKGFGPQPCSAI